MRFDVISLFPDMVQQAARVGVTGKAIENETVILNVWNPRDYTHDKHNTVDEIGRASCRERVYLCV